jgi:hypothetical protein
MAKFRKRHRAEERQEIPPQSTGDTTIGAADRDRIAARAYERYLARGASDGGAMDDWLAAERELASHHTDRKRE